MLLGHVLARAVVAAQRLTYSVPSVNVGGWRGVLKKKIQWARFRCYCRRLKEKKSFPPVVLNTNIPIVVHTTQRQPPRKMTTATLVSRALPVLPEGWAAAADNKDFKVVGKLTASTQRAIEPVGPHFLAHARRARHKRTFSEDDRIQAQERAKKVEEEDDAEMSEPEDPMMLQRDAKDWKV